MAMINKPSLRPEKERASANWPWLVLAVWLAVSAGQLWSMQVESVLAGEICSATSGVSIAGGVR